jgi:hypothetical protein
MPQGSLPAAKEILARFEEVSGASSWKSHKSARMKAEMEIPGAGMTALVEALFVFPNIMVQKVVLPGMGESISGFDGKVAWSIDPMRGPRIVTGDEAEAMKESADPAAAYGHSENIVNSETVEKTTMDGQECYRIKHTWKSGRTSYDCFSVASGLLVARSMVQPSQMGDMELTQLHRDYKDFGGLKRATLTVTQMMGQEMNLRLTAWEWDNVDPKDVALPAEIKALLDKKP